MEVLTTDTLQHEFACMVDIITNAGWFVHDTEKFAQADLLHTAMNLDGNARELTNGIRRHVVYSKDLDTDYAIEMLGNLEFHMEHLRKLLKVSREEVLQVSMQNFAMRYQSIKDNGKEGEAS